MGKQIEVDELAVQIHGHISRGRATGIPTHVLCGTRNDIPYVLSVTAKLFPDIPIKGPPDLSAELREIASRDLIESYGDVMVGELGSMCLHYQRAVLFVPRAAQRFRLAAALVLNYCTNEHGGPCILEDEERRRKSEMTVRDFLTVYPSADYVDVEIPRERPYWDFGCDRPVY